MHALRLDERYSEAEALGVRALRDAGPDSRRLLEAEIARLHYYFGRFGEGADAAQRLIGPNDLASARAATAASANSLALNRGHAALRHARDAILRLSLLGPPREDAVDARIQVVHTLAHMGAHAEAEATARSSLSLARRTSGGREVARAEYALGFALWFSGSDAAVDRLLSAERMTRDRAGALWHWILFCIAACLRDLGYLEPADAYATRSGVALRYERAWFQIRARDPQLAAMWIRPPIRRDEVPFLRAICGAIRLQRRGSPHDGSALRVAARAADEFGRQGLEHWRRGSLWIAAADATAPSSMREELARSALDSLSGRASNWGFYDPELLKPWSRDQGVHPLLARLLETHRRQSGSAGAQLPLLLPTLRLLNPEAIAVLSEAGLSPADIRTATAALELWLEDGALRRRELARRLVISDGSARTRMGSLRQKIGVSAARGGEPIVRWLADRELLSPTTQRRVIQLLAGKRGG